MKKIATFMLVLSMISGMLTPVLAQEKDDTGIQNKNLEYAEIIFEKTPITTNINKYFFTEKDARKHVIVDGKSAVRMNRAASCYYMMIDLDDNVFPKSEREQSIAVTVEYYDEGYGLFTLRYDSVKNTVADVCEDHVDVIKMQDTREWKTHTFYVDDAAFGGTLNDSDIIVALWSTRTGQISPEDLIVHSVKVERVMPQKPVILNLMSEQYGNIFGSDEKKEMYFHFNNITETVIKMDLQYSVMDEEKNIYETGEVIKEVLPDTEDQIFLFETNVSRYGLYSVLVTGTMEYEFGGEIHTKEVHNSLNFSVVNKFKPGEEKNADFGVCTHMGQTEKRVPAMTAKIAAGAGIGILRDEERWNDVEKQKDVYDFSGRFEYPHEIKKNGLEMIFIAALGNTNYDSSIGSEGWRDSGGMPNTKEDMEAFGRYILEAIKASDGAIKYVEIWNEPNHSGFNPLGRTPEVYTELLKVCYPMIKDAYPDIKVIGGSMAGLGLDWLEAIFEAGGYDYMDAVGVHPYDWGGSFRMKNYLEGMTSLRELMNKYGEGNEIWLTEMGWSTAAVSQHNQSIYMVQLYALSKAKDSADKIIMYEFQDSGTDALDTEHNFGMIRYWGNSSTVMNTFLSGGAGKDVRFEDVSTPWSAKPTYISITAMNKMIGTAEFAEEIEINETMQAYRFKRKDGKSAIIVWADGKPANISLKVNSPEVEIYDFYSNLDGTVKTDDGVFNFTVQKEPQYIVGDFDSATLAEAVIGVTQVDAAWAKGDSVKFEFSDKLGRDLRIEAEVADIFEVTHNNNIVNGKGSIVIKGTPDTELMNYKIKFKLYDGDNLCHIETKNVQFVEPISIGVDKTKIKGTLDRWKINVTVKNNSTEKSYSGSVKIVAPEELKKYGNTPFFSNLRPGESVVVPINLPRTVKQRLTDIEAEIVLDDGQVFSQEEQISYADIQYTKTKPTIDGVARGSEWKGTWINVDRREYIGSTGLRGWAGEKDCSFSYNLMWDEENLYMCVIAKDDIFSQNYTGYNMWQGDSIQVGLTEGNPKELLDTSYNELGFALTPEGSEAYRYSSYSGLTGGTIDNTKIKITKGRGTVCYEVAMPWSEAMSATYVPVEGNEIYFSALFNDNDGNGRRGWLEYTDGIGARKNAALFDGVHLIK